MDDDLIIKVKDIYDENDELILSSKPNTIVKILLEKAIPDFGIVRKKK